MPSQMVLEEKSGEVEEIKEIVAGLQVDWDCEFEEGSGFAASGL